ncbi:MAG: four helix bundle protein [Cyclobacteriaceae bacterium]|nr:four helix bundle protein [Cyclobacteriaceae bacterium]
MRNFRELRVWHDSIALAVYVYGVTQSFPKEEEYGMTRQVRRSVVSIASNTAEGCSRSSDKEFCHYLEISVGSAFEAETQITIAKRIGILDEQRADDCIERLRRLQKAINALIKKTRRL